MQSSKVLGLFGFALLLLSGCVTPPNHTGSVPATSGGAAETPGYRVVKTLKTGRVDSNGRFIDAPANEWDLHVTLRAIPGAFAGHPVDRHSMLIPIRFGNSFDLSMSDLEEAIAPLAQRATGQTTASGISVQPTDTRFLRVATFYYDARAGEDVMGAGFFDPATREHVTLSYFDRPCTVRGTVQDGDGTISIALDIPAAGLYWVRTDDTDPVHSKMTAANPDTVLWYLNFARQ
jgi:hypothetical protein